MHIYDKIEDLFVGISNSLKEETGTSVDPIFLARLFQESVDQFPSEVLLDLGKVKFKDIVNEIDIYSSPYKKNEESEGGDELRFTCYGRYMSRY